MLLGLGLPLLVAAAPARSPAPAVIQVPLARYPVAPPAAVDDNRLPQFLDLDETVVAHLRPDGSYVSMQDQVRLKMKGSGDFALRLPGPVRDVQDLGGDIRPGLDAGRITFLGHLDGLREAGADATLDPALIGPTLPLGARLSYTLDGNPISAAALVGQSGTVTTVLRLENRTAQAVSLTSGQPAGLSGVAALATTLDALSHAPELYTPETDLSQVLPVPATLPLAQAHPAPGTTYLPMQLTVLVRLSLAATEVGSAGAEQSVKSNQRLLTWRSPLPARTTDGAATELTWSFRASHLTVPAVEVRAVPGALPADEFRPPAGLSWAGALAAGGDHSGVALSAQLGMADLNRLGNQGLPVGRPGPGPERLQLAYLFDSMAPAAIRAAAPRPQPLNWPGLFLATAVSALVGLNAWWAWSRN